MLLTADWHLTDNPLDEYRWNIFPQLKAILRKAKEPPALYILGDLTDRKDRHSAALVNRVVKEIGELAGFCSVIRILMGNHDKPINGTPFWQFLNILDRPDCAIFFHTEPFVDGRLLLLPYAADPREEWKGIPIQNYKAVFMHQTVTGALGNNGHKLENKKMPIFPRGIKIYSGDIHTPQTIGRVQYVGAPYPIAFGDDYPCRALELDEDYSIVKEHFLSAPAKHMLRIDNVDDLDELKTNAGDRAQVFFTLRLADLDLWPAIQTHILNWAAERGVSIAAIKPVLEGYTVSHEDDPKAEEELFQVDPEHVLRLFTASEKIDEKLIDLGIELLTEVLL